MKPFHILILLLVVAVWGINFVFVKIGLQELPPLLLCCSRFVLVSLPAIFFFKRPTVPFKWVLIYSLTMFVFQFALMFSGIQAGVSAGLASLMLQIQVFFSIFFAALFLKEKINRWQIFGALLSFCGIVMVGAHIGASATWSGLCLVLAAAAMWGLGSVIVKKMGKTQSGSLLVWGSLIAWPPLFLLSLAFEESLPIVLNVHQLSLETYVAVLFIAGGATVFGFSIWNRLLQIYPVSLVSPFTLLVPLFGMLGSVLFLDETLEGWKILAGSLVISGLCLNIFGSRFLPKRVADE